MMDDDFTILDQVPSVVHLNVGGTIFLTSRSTLCQVRRCSPAPGRAKRDT